MIREEKYVSDSINDQVCFGKPQVQTSNQQCPQLKKAVDENLQPSMIQTIGVKPFNQPQN